MTTKMKLSSEWIYKFYKELEENRIENHGLLIMKNGEVVFEEYAAPYSKDMPHTLFSVTKSVVSTAVGFAISEGLFSLDSKILPLFPEYKHCKSDEWENLTVRSLLTMQSNKAFSFTQDMTGNYAEMFMKAPFRKDKGFLYSNNDVHVLSALIQKLSGESVVDYLMPRLFEPLGIEKPFWETNSIGECIGGTGAYLKLSDLAKICQCYADGGKYNGKQVIPEEWTREATKIQVKFGDRDDYEGYGYLFWIKDGAFSMTGMFGQIITYYPKYDAVVASFNSTLNEGENERIVNEILTKAFDGETDDEWDKRLTDYLQSRGEKPIIGEEMPDIPVGKTYYITPLSDIIGGLMFPASVITRSITSSFAVRPKKNMNRISFEQSENVFTVKWFEEEDEVVINCGLDGKARMSECKIKGYPYKIWAYAYCENGVIKAVVKPLNTLSTQFMTFDFSKNAVKIQMKSTPRFLEFIEKNAGESSIVSGLPKLKPFIMKVINKVLLTTEMPLKFRQK